MKPAWNRGLSLLLWSLALHGGARAERLEMMNFPFTSGWSMVGEAPITHEGRAVGTMQMFQPTAGDPKSPTNLVFTYEVEQKKAISPAEYVANHVRALEPQCDSLQVIRPTHVIERGVPVSYAKLFCGKLNPMGHGSIQLLKALQGRNTMFLVIRKWVTPVFTTKMATSPTPEAFLKGIFGSDEAAAQWLERADEAQRHMERAVTLCSSNEGEFGSRCVAN